MTAAKSKLPAALCPICRAKTEKEWRPFCSKRCADVDLGRWMTGGYAIPTDDSDDREFTDEA